jgi:prevent-host-death family protein
MIATVRMAKAQLSRLLERAAAGEEILITSDGRPKAKLVGVGVAPRPFRVNRSLLRTRPRRAGLAAEVLVREERDSRS